MRSREGSLAPGVCHYHGPLGGHLLRHPADGGQAPRQLHRRDHAVRRRPGPCRPGDLLHRRPARRHGAVRPGRPPRPHLRHGGDPDRGRPGPRALPALPPGGRDGARRAELAAVERDAARRAQPHAPVPRQVGRAARDGLRRAALLPGAPVGRRARLPRPRGPGGGGPARAPRAHAPHRGALQQPLRRDARGARAPDPRGRRARARPPGARPQDVHHRRLGAGHGLRARRARHDPPQVQARGGRLGARDRPPRGQAGDREPDRDRRGRPRALAGGDRARVRAAPATATSRPPWPTRWSIGWPRSASATTSCAATRPRSSRSSTTGAGKARAISSRTLLDVREAMGVGPVRRGA